MNIQLCSLVIVLTSTVLFSEVVATNSPADRTPTGWNVAQMAREGIGMPWIDGGVWTNATGRILTWKIHEDRDRRPFSVYSESAVLWLETQTPGGKKWKLAHVFRHQKHPNARWFPSICTDSTQRDASAIFDRPPRVDEVEAFLRVTEWTFAPAEGWKMLDGEVCVEGWRECTGSAPPEALVKEVREWQHKGAQQKQ